ncbi:MAG: hypothetical protein JW809_17180 [Pirellulales bacterium]|nr:hypothetical protein [Pirellulales bacterium]
MFSPKALPWATVLLVPLACFTTTTLAHAKGRVELTLAVEKGAPLTAQQTWMRELSQAGVQNIRIRQSRTGDRAAIEVRGPEDRPIYVVTGTLTAGNEVLVPGGRFRDGQADRLARWLNDVALHGPPAEGEPAGAFGLSRRQNEQVRQALAPPVAASTRGKPRADAVRQIRDQLPLRLESEPAAAELGKDRVAEELKGLSAGTALAYVLRGPGYCLIPRRGPGGAIEFAVVPAGQAKEIWPVGWPPDTPRLKLLPKLFEKHPVRIENVSVAKVLEAVAGRLEIPLLLDHNALARHGIDPTKILVTIPPGEMDYDKVLVKAVFEARLRRELRVDDAGKPFFWVTSVKPL